MSMAPATSFANVFHVPSQLKRDVEGHHKPNGNPSFVGLSGVKLNNVGPSDDLNRVLGDLHSGATYILTRNLVRLGKRAVPSTCAHSNIFPYRRNGFEGCNIATLAIENPSNSLSLRTFLVLRVHLANVILRGYRLLMQAKTKAISHSGRSINGHSEPDDDPAFVHFSAQIRQTNPTDHPRYVARNFNRGSRDVQAVDLIRLSKRRLGIIVRHLHNLQFCGVLS
jgi:hypothetical protein